MLTVHFGAGNIGRGFIGEILHQNQMGIAFVDVNEKVIDALNERNSYTIEEASEENRSIHIDQVYGINNAKHPEKVIEAIGRADLITTAIGPNILPLIAPLIAQGLHNRKASGNLSPIDVIACENMIGGSSFLKKAVIEQLEETDLEYVEETVGFPDAAVDRIVPQQTHEDVLKVTVEPYKEWVVSAKDLKNKDLTIQGVKVVDDLAPYIERKLFTVNTGHATTAYQGAYAGHQTIDAALQDEHVLNAVQNVLEETGALLVDKWQFDPSEHAAYIQKILERFQNPRLSDDITRVGRTPIRKLGYDERFIRPIREAKESGLQTEALVSTVAKLLCYNDPNDQESVELQKRLSKESVSDVVKDITQLQDEQLTERIAEAYHKVKKH